MAGINDLRQVHVKKGDDFLKNLLNNFVIINEKIEGTFFGVKKEENDRFKYFKKTGEISYVDRVMMKYYNPAISHFEGFPEEKRQRIPSSLFFGFEYISKKDQPTNKKVKNNLVLTYIHRLDDDGKPIETLQTGEDLKKWAEFLEVEAPPIIFEGILDDEQKRAIQEFVYSPFKELADRFKTTSFTKYIISVLNPDKNENSPKEGLMGEIESIIFRFYDENDENPKANIFLAKMVDPIFQEKAKEVKPEGQNNRSSDYIWLIVIDLMNHIEMYDEFDLRERCEEEEDYDLRFIKLMNNIFKEFIKEYSYKYEGLELNIPEYLRNPEFDIDYSLINDSEISSILQKDETYKEIYRILTNFFRKPRKKSSSTFFDDNLLNQLNIQVQKLKRVVIGDVIYESLFPSFGEFIGTDPNQTGLIENQEDFITSDKLTRSEKVNLLIGAFEPIHIGHIKAMTALKNNNGLPCVVVAIIKKNRASNFSERTVRLLLEKVQREHSDLIKDIRIINYSSIKDIIKCLKPEYDPVLWGTSKRRIKDYILQLDYIKKKDLPLRLSEDFKLVEVPSYQDSEAVLNTLLSQDYAKFKELVPKSISSEFFNLQSELNLTSQN